MSLMRPMDPAFPIDRQIAIDASAIVLINLFTLDKADEQAFLDAWQADAAFMKRQPGFISTQMHRAVGESPAYLNYAVWESTADFRAAFSHPEFRGGSSRPIRPRRSPHRISSRRSPCRASVWRKQSGGGGGMKSLSVGMISASGSPEAVIAMRKTSATSSNRKMRAWLLLAALIAVGSANSFPAIWSWEKVV